MKNVLLFILCLLSFSVVADAQSFTTSSGSSDTVTKSYTSGTTIEVHNDLMSSSSTPVAIKWRVATFAFDAGWDAAATGICDNYLCRYNLNNLATSSEKSDPYSNGSFSDFHVLFAANNPANGTSAKVTVRLTDTATNYSRTLTFIAYKSALGISTSVVNSDNVSLYPNPAREAINVIFDKQADVKTIAIYNMIGKAMRIFKPTDNNSARLDLDNIPSGVYFVRLMNSDGEIVATRRFTRQ